MARCATIKEIPRIVSMARHFQESAEFQFKFDAVYFSNTVRAFIEDPARLCAVVGNPAVGVLMACYGDSPIYPIRVADELLLWVEPQHRGAAWNDLHQFYEQWAEQNNCSRIQMTAQQTVRPDAMRRLYRRTGYELCDLVFVKSI